MRWYSDGSTYKGIQNFFFYFYFILFYYFFLLLFFFIYIYILYIFTYIIFIIQGIWLHLLTTSVYFSILTSRMDWKIPLFKEEFFSFLFNIKCRKHNILYFNTISVFCLMSDFFHISDVKWHLIRKLFLAQPMNKHHTMNMYNHEASFFVHSHITLVSIFKYS